ncbi:PREDICTED: uncharacterized protein LOC104712141 [Camelina sativa]|uniref:Uncharacterized protein LOC104712141 n=1 Tax=Camelina sativa TaxID=90675 RepID=A0ABM0TJE2_CAMSA|nr:PREDICTED: uncharacterized protein LOC104712141 [Camelina sativa]
MAGDADSFQIRDSTEFDSPLPNEPTVEKDAETEANAEPPPGFFFAGERLLPLGSSKDPEYRRQCDIFYDQFQKSEGFDVDWDNLGYKFFAFNFAWEQHYHPPGRKEELLKLLTQTAIDVYNNETGSKIEFVEHVKANTAACRGIMYYITFSAKEVSSPDSVPKRYQAKVERCGDEISVSMVRLRPTQD